MRKYNLSKIMKRAWELVKKAGNIMSVALKSAWAEAKNAIEKVAFKGYAKVAKMENPYDDECCFLYFKKWEKHGKIRIYINDYKRRTLGYLENGVVTINNRQGNDAEQVEYALDKFFSTYAIA